MTRIEHRVQVDGQTFYVNNYLAGKTILSITRDGKGITKILTEGTPTGKQVKYIGIGSGMLGIGLLFGTPLSYNEQLVILFQDTP